MCFVCYQMYEVKFFLANLKPLRIENNLSNNHKITLAYKFVSEVKISL